MSRLNNLFLLSIISISCFLSALGCDKSDVLEDLKKGISLGKNLTNDFQNKINAKEMAKGNQFDYYIDQQGTLLLYKVANNLCLKVEYSDYQGTYENAELTTMKFAVMGNFSRDDMKRVSDFFSGLFGFTPKVEFQDSIQEKGIRYIFQKYRDALGTGHMFPEKESAILYFFQGKYFDIFQKRENGEKVVLSRDPIDSGNIGLVITDSKERKFFDKFVNFK